MAVTKIRPKTRIEHKYNEDGWKDWYEIEYYCPTCSRNIRGYKSDNACDECGTFYDWGKFKPEIVEIRTVRWE